MLTGRVSRSGGSFVLDGDQNYQYLGERRQEMSYNEVGLFVSDSWRWKPSITDVACGGSSRRPSRLTPFACTAAGLSAGLWDHRRGQHVQTRDDDQVCAAADSLREGLEGLQHRLEQHRAKRRHRVAAADR